MSGGNSWLILTLDNYSIVQQGLAIVQLDSQFFNNVWDLYCK